MFLNGDEGLAYTGILSVIRLIVLGSSSMFAEISLIGFALAILSLSAAFVCWHRLVAAQRARDALQDKVNLLIECLQARIDGIGAESNTRLATYFSALKFEISEQITLLEMAQINSATPYVVAAQETEYTRLIERKERFIGYRDTLLNANVQIDVMVRYLKDDYALIENLLDRLNSRRLDSAMGNLELETIEGVINNLRREAVDDLIGELKGRKKKAEFDHVMKFREAMLAAEKKILDAEVSNPMVARAARTLGED